MVRGRFVATVTEYTGEDNEYRQGANTIVRKWIVRFVQVALLVRVTPRCARYCPNIGHVKPLKLRAAVQNWVNPNKLKTAKEKW